MRSSTDNHIIFNRYPELKQFVHLLREEVQRAQRPATEVIMDDEDVMRTLKISKRKLQYLISDRILPFHIVPGGPRRYFLLQDILDLLEKNRTEPIAPRL